MGLFGLLGSGNIGNDGSMQAMLDYLRTEHPRAELDAMCGGPELVRAQYGIPAAPLHWYRGEYRTASRLTSMSMKAAGKFVDAFRTAAWVRRHDVVIVPGMGVLEATLPLRPWGTPYSLYLLCAAGRLFGTKVALVSVGANVIGNRATRMLVTAAARLASYRSYRDELSWAAMHTAGVDTSADEVYPDLAFALPNPAAVPGPTGPTGTVGVGVMAFHGGDEDRAQADDIYRNYVDRMKVFVRWLVDGGRRVRLFTGDRVDEPVVAEIITDALSRRPDLDPSTVTAAPVTSLDELMLEMSAVDTVVATRYHNVLCALKVGKPTLSIGYAAKNEVLMARMGLARFCHPARRIELNLLIDQFTALETEHDQLRVTLAARNVQATEGIRRQFAALDTALFDRPSQVDLAATNEGIR